jgi:flagellar basal body-associated protein FliL
MNVAGFPAQQRTIVWIAIAVIGLVGLAFIFWWLSQEPTLTAPSIKAVITKEQAEAQIKTYSNLIEENIVLPPTKNEAKSQIEAAQEIEGVFS